MPIGLSCVELRGDAACCSQRTGPRQLQRLIGGAVLSAPPIMYYTATIIFDINVAIILNGSSHKRVQVIYHGNRILSVPL
jgi:hypothetical protein